MSSCICQLGLLWFLRFPALLIVLCSLCNNCSYSVEFNNFAIYFKEVHNWNEATRRFFETPFFAPFLIFRDPSRSPVACFTQGDLGRVGSDGWRSHGRHCHETDPSHFLEWLWSGQVGSFPKVFAPPHIWALQPHFHLVHLGTLQLWDDEPDFTNRSCCPDLNGHNICVLSKKGLWKERKR